MRAYRLQMHQSFVGLDSLRLDGRFSTQEMSENIRKPICVRRLQPSSLNMAPLFFTNHLETLLDGMSILK